MPLCAARTFMPLLLLLLAFAIAKRTSDDLEVSHDVADFIVEVTTNLFNASYVEILTDSEADNAPVILAQKLHLFSRTVITTKIRSKTSASAFLERVFAAFSTNSKVYVICLVRQKHYLKHVFPLIEPVWTHLIYSHWIVLGRGETFAMLVLQRSPCTFYLLTDIAQGYVLLGPSYAKRNNCSGVRTIARWPKSTGAAPLMLSPPAKEERSNVLALACDGSENNVRGMYECYWLTEEDGLVMMGRYLNITRFERVTAPLPFLPDDRFPGSKTLTGLLTRGEADILLLHMVLSEPRVYSAKFLFPVVYDKLTFLYPSPRILTSSFTVLKIFSVQVWCASGASLVLLVLLLRGIAHAGERPLHITGVAVSLLVPQDKYTNMSRGRKLSVRIVTAALHFLGFVMWYCFTGGYISYLNLPLYEEAPDTADKILAAFKEGRLQPCIWKNSFLNVSLANPKSVLMSRLRDSVDDWTPFMLEDMDECAERTRRRHAVFIDGSLYQKRYAYSLRGQVEVSSESLQDFVPMCYVLPKASPYEDLIQNAIMRMFEAGLFNQFELRYRYRNLSSPKNFSNEDVGRVLQIENTALSFCCLAAGLAMALMAFAGETRSRIAIRKSPCWPVNVVSVTRSGRHSNLQWSARVWNHQRRE